MDLLNPFCERWGVSELALFGSVLRGDFGPDSDVDVLVAFLPGVRRGLIDVMRMEEELEQLFGRKADLLTRRGLEVSREPDVRDAILGSSEVVYGR